VRLPGFTLDSLTTVGGRVRDLYVDGAADPARTRSMVDDTYVTDLARAVTGELGAKVGVAPRLYVKKLADVLDRVDLHPTYDPRVDYELTVADSELTEVERNARAGASSPDDIDLEL
jgi:hypothetical protein